LGIAPPFDKLRTPQLDRHSEFLIMGEVSVALA